MTAAEAPLAGRLGPRPLPLHLALAMSSGAGALAALPAARAGCLPWAPGLAAEAAELTGALAEADAGALTEALADAQAARIEAMLAGIRAYHAHPYRRDLPTPDIVWREGTTRLLDYGGEGPPAALFVPSLVNRYYVLDLMAEQSLARWLVGRGVRVFVLDWDAPGEAERDFDLDDYVCGRLEGALDRALSLVGAPLALAGYCLGGNLALAAALRRRRDLAGLALLATPWDFHAGQGGQASLLALFQGQLDMLLAAFGELPVDLLQTLFTWLDPGLAQRKFRRFATLQPDGAAARTFVALEDWLNDGVALAPRVARRCLVDWYGLNLPVRGEWLVAGRPVDPGALALPAFVAVPARDRIVPPASARALAEALPGARRITPEAGHIGMMVGHRARAGLWQPLCDWLHGLAGGAP